MFVLLFPYIPLSVSPHLTQRYPHCFRKKTKTINLWFSVFFFFNSLQTGFWESKESSSEHRPYIVAIQLAGSLRENEMVLSVPKAAGGGYPARKMGHCLLGLTVGGKMDMSWLSIRRLAAIFWSFHKPHWTCPVWRFQRSGVLLSPCIPLQRHREKMLKM